MELGPLPYPRKRTAPTVSRSPKAASGAAAMHWKVYHIGEVLSCVLFGRVPWRTEGELTFLSGSIKP
jgi:hypothetical protein